MPCWPRCNFTSLPHPYFLLLRKAVTMVPQASVPLATSALFSAALSLLSLALLLFFCVIRKKRRMEGTYKPSAEERRQVGSAGSERPGLPLPLPKEERLI